VLLIAAMGVIAGLWCKWCKLQFELISQFLAFFGIALAAQAIAPTRSCTQRWSVCLSVVCHIRAPCLHRSTDLHAI